MELSKNKIKFIQSLSMKKYRDKENVFIAEGDKLVADILPYFSTKIIVATESWISTHKFSSEEIISVPSKEELKKISLLTTPSEVLAVLYKKQQSSLIELFNTNDLILALDSIQDPGNLGTIVRIADWFGIKNIICSNETVDIYNSKSVQATMGALSRVNIYYTDLSSTLDEFRQKKWPVYGTYLDGQPIYEKSLQNYGIILMGNEGKGISAKLTRFVSERLLIPSYPKGTVTSESLNVAVATAIICSEFRRR